MRTPYCLTAVLLGLFLSSAASFAGEPASGGDTTCCLGRRVRLRQTRMFFQNAQEQHAAVTSENSGELVALGDSLCGKGDYDAAIDAYTKAIRLNPNCADAYSPAPGAIYARATTIRPSQTLRSRSGLIQSPLLPILAEAWPV